MDDRRAGDRIQPGQPPVAVHGRQRERLPVDCRLVEIDEGRGRCGAHPAGGHRPLGRLCRAGLVFVQVAEHGDQVGACLLIRRLRRNCRALIANRRGRVLVLGDRDVA